MPSKPSGGSNTNTLHMDLRLYFFFIFLTSQFSVKFICSLASKSDHVYNLSQAEQRTERGLYLSCPGEKVAFSLFWPFSLKVERSLCEAVTLWSNVAAVHYHLVFLKMRLNIHPNTSRIF